LSSHQYSRQAARYAEAASEFGRQKLLMVYDVLFMEQAKWSADGNIEAVVAKVLTRPELQELKKILQSPTVNDAIDKEVQLGLQRKIQSTPTFFISSRKKQEKVEGYLGYDPLRQVLDQMF
jgi:protein-disulfide isomerase